MEQIIGQTIKTIRPMSDEEMENEGWGGERSAVLVLSNGVKLYASSDYEGNDSGAIFGVDGENSFGLAG